MRKLLRQLRLLSPFLMLFAMLAILWGNALPALALTSQDVTINATPAYMSISNAPINWTINDVADAGSKSILKDTIYYSNPLGDTTTPTVGGAVDAECRFTITNASTVAIDLIVLFPDHTGGDACANSNTGANDTTKFGAKTYFTGQASGAWIIAKSAGSDVGKDALGATTNIKWGLVYESQSNDWTSGDLMTSTVTLTATVD